MARQANPAEDVVEKILNKLKDLRLIPGFLRNHPSDRLDSEGIDFLIFLNNGLAVALQVKTSSGNLTLKEKEHLRKHPLVKKIIFISVNLLPSHPDRLDREVERDMRRMLNLRSD